MLTKGEQAVRRVRLNGELLGERQNSCRHKRIAANLRRRLGLPLPPFERRRSDVLVVWDLIMVLCL